jgi:hypothetical protein
MSVAFVTRYTSVAAEEGKTHLVIDHLVTIKLTGAETAGAFAMVEESPSPDMPKMLSPRQKYGIRMADGTGRR